MVLVGKFINTFGEWHGLVMIFGGIDRLLQCAASLQL
jgi:hypothetical protein